MIAALFLVLAADFAEADAPKAPPPASIIDLFEGDSLGKPGFSDEPEVFRRCRVYRCGLPKLEELLDRKEEAGEPRQK